MLSPGLSMLWESADAEQALRDRFGLDGPVHAESWLRTVLAEHWGLTLRELPRLTLSDHNAIAWARCDEGPLVVKWSGREDLFGRLASTTRLLAELRAMGLPVAAPLLTREGMSRIEVDGPAGPLSLAVLPEVDGAWLDVADLEAVRASGTCLASLHLALAELDPESLPGEAPQPLPHRLTGWLANRDPGRAPRASARLAALATDLPTPDASPQLVHGDFRAANLLVRRSRVVAVLDFDEVRTDHPLVDLAQASTYLATLFHDWGPTPAPAREALCAGYESVRPLGELESRWLEALTLWMGIAAIQPQDDGRWATAVEQPVAAPPSPGN